MRLKKWEWSGHGGLKSLGKEFGLIPTAMGRSLKQGSATPERLSPSLMVIIESQNYSLAEGPHNLLGERQVCYCS